MTTTLIPPARQSHAAPETLTLLVFVGTLFLSAFLLFSVQPMLTKLVLPILGGSPAVWSVATVFFQAALLAGYAYAHALTRTMSPRAAAILHLLVLAAAFSVLPIALPKGWDAPQSNQSLWLFGFLATAVGVPFFAVSANGPLLQAWFARTGHPGALDPYLLYGASNIGSIAALLLYPFVIEPLLPLSTQSRIWSVLFVVLGCGIACCAALLPSGSRNLSHSIGRSPGDAKVAVTWRERALWIGRAFVPSGLLVSVTAHLSTDVAAAPLLWVVPLAAFLLTFVLAFRPTPLVSAAALAGIQVWLAALALVSMEVHLPPLIALPAHLGLFATSCLICNRALFLGRPAPERLTDFYLTIAFGGVLGGAFSALAAPVLFSSLVEYPLLIILALLCRPGFVRSLRSADKRGIAGAFVLSAAIMLAGLFVPGGWSTPDHVRSIVTVLIAAGALAVWREPARVAVFLGMCALSIIAYGDTIAPRETFRSFFGVIKLREMIGGQYRIMEHGTTLHGAMRIRMPDGTRYTGPVEPTTYYTPEGALGTALASIRQARGTLTHVSIIGLGVGAMACHVQPDEALTFYEIDPLVVRIARDRNLFRFLSDCAPNSETVVGDARLMLAGAQRRNDVLLIDAFSSDAVPAHLLTREAMALYQSKLAPHGVMLFHISNQFLDLRSLVARTAADLGMQTFVRADDDGEAFDKRLRTPSTVAAIVRDADDLGVIAKDPRWIRMAPDLARKPWTGRFLEYPRAAARWGTLVSLNTSMTLAVSNAWSIDRRKDHDVFAPLGVRHRYRTRCARGSGIERLGPNRRDALYCPASTPVVAEPVCFNSGRRRSISFIA